MDENIDDTCVPFNGLKTTKILFLLFTNFYSTKHVCVSCY